MALASICANPIQPAWQLAVPLPPRSLTRKEPLALAKGQVLRLGLDAATAIGCDAGVLWLTVDGDPQDYVLEVGEALLLQDLRPLHVVAALADSVMSVVQVGQLPFRPEPWTRRTARAVRAWLCRR